ncbi:toprim domain-containing protein [Desulfobulbus sp.]|uniref:toprim domain-containing protein n=1 Tax=Desulfobulbus sp. TaxID=895 RepID=UPI00286F2F0D|nr:toprim domain-containing protein [Desulfobulbus sp.]
MSYPDACAALQVEPRQNSAEHFARQPTKERPWEPEPERQPSEQWRQRAETFLAECREHLSSEAGRAALYGRALAIEFALRHGLGWNPTDRYDAPEAWGLEPWLNSKGNPGKLFLPAGLVVPTFRKAGPVAVKIRRRDWQPGDAWPKYQAVKGGGNGALILGKPGLPVALVESELDALLIAQEAPGLCSVMALGSASNRPHTATVDFLKAAPVILVALDFDQPDARGQRAGARAWAWWREHFPQSRRWPPAAGKAPGEMHQTGIPVRMWVEVGLVGETRQDAPHAPRAARHDAESEAVAAMQPVGAHEAEQPLPSWCRADCHGLEKSIAQPLPGWCSTRCEHFHQLAIPAAGMSWWCCQEEDETHWRRSRLGSMAECPLEEGRR